MYYVVILEMHSLLRTNVWLHGNYEYLEFLEIIEVNFL